MGALVSWTQNCYVSAKGLQVQQYFWLFSICVHGIHDHLEAVYSLHLMVCCSYLLWEFSWYRPHHTVNMKQPQSSASHSSASSGESAPVRRSWLFLRITVYLWTEVSMSVLIFAKKNQSCALKFCFKFHASSDTEYINGADASCGRALLGSLSTWGLLTPVACCLRSVQPCF